MKDYIMENKLKRIMKENKGLKKKLFILEEQNKKLLSLINELISKLI